MNNRFHFARGARLVLMLAGFSFVAAVAAGGVAAADKPLVQLTPSGAGLYVEVNHLAEHAREFQTSPLLARLQAFPPWMSWREKNGDALQKIARQIGQQLDAPPSDLWNHVLRHAALAVWPKDGREKDHALLLIRADDSALLRRAVDGFCRSLTRSEDVRWREKSCLGIKYRAGAAPQKTDRRQLFLAVFGDTAAITTRETILRQVLSLQTGGSDPPRSLAKESSPRSLAEKSSPRSLAEKSSPRSLADSPEFQMAAGDWPSQAAILVVIDPRPWDAAMAARVESSDPSRRAGRKAQWRTWRAMETSALALSFDERVSLRGRIRFNRALLPSRAAAVLEGLQGETTFFNHVPDDCLLAVGGCVDFRRLTRLFLPGDASGSASAWSFSQGLLGLLGPEVGAYATAGRGEAPLEWVAGVQLFPTAGGFPTIQRLLERKKAPVSVNVKDQATTDSSGGLKQAAVARILQIGGALNAPTPLQVQSFVAGGASLTSPENWPTLRPGLSAAYTFDKGFLLAGASSDVLRRAALVRPETSLAARLKRRGIGDDRPPGHALYVNGARLRRLLAERSDDLITFLADARSLDKETAARAVEQVNTVLRLADDWLITARVEPDQVELGIDISADRP